MRIAICEDDPNDAAQLTEMLSRYLKANRIEADTDVFESGEAFLAVFSPGKYQIIFMDIYMKEDGMTGMTAAAKADSIDRDAAVVFVTNSDRHLYEGYDYSVYYIIKPYNEEKLDKAMGKCRAQIEKHAVAIEIMVDRYPVKVRLQDIYSVESVRHECVFKFAASEMAVARMSLDILEEQLGGFPFLRCHRSYIVNLSHTVKNTGNDFVMNNEKLTPIGRSYRDEAQKAFRDYFWKLIQGDVT